MSRQNPRNQTQEELAGRELRRTFKKTVKWKSGRRYIPSVLEQPSVGGQRSRSRPFSRSAGLGCCLRDVCVSGFSDTERTRASEEAGVGREVRVGGEEVWLPGPARADLGSSALLVGCHGTFV